eukprot:TRINITY_DN79363_c0_g1_i1.p1 TRINITY_DN79363_c0_g1~~TRINITY_DN79363_c0_g1_i1.p1  ORF type:complete len:330 (-),score=121.96 TRINITY_DN79363_c0_g1_i1:39-1028(-)
MAGKISYNDAMASLKSMFSAVDTEVIAMVLQANEGLLDPTINALISMQASAEASPKGENVYENAQPVPAKPAVSPPKAVHHEPEEELGFPELADDFLRPPSYFTRAAKSQEDDEAFARMLQAEFDKAANRQASVGYGQPQPQRNPYPNQPNPARNSPAPVVAPAAAANRSPENSPVRGDDEVVVGEQGQGIGEAFSNFNNAAKRKMEILKEKFKKNRERQAAARGDGFALANDDEEVADKGLMKQVSEENGNAGGDDDMFRPINIDEDAKFSRQASEEDQGGEDPMLSNANVVKVGQASNKKSDAAAEPKKKPRKQVSDDGGSALDFFF